MWLETDEGAHVLLFTLWTLYFSQSVSHWRTYLSLLSTNTTAGFIQPESGSPGGYCFIICKVKSTGSVLYIEINQYLATALHKSTHTMTGFVVSCRTIQYDLSIGNITKWMALALFLPLAQHTGHRLYPTSYTAQHTLLFPCPLIWPESIQAEYTSRFIIT